jgi:hypothetical protein
MFARRAVLQTLPKSSFSPRLPFHKNCHFRTRSESTLLQLLIPFHFSSRRYNAYKKPGRGCLLPAAKFYNSSLCTRRHPGRAGTAASSFLSTTYGHLPSLVGCSTPTSNRCTQTLPFFSTAAKCVTRRNCRNSIRFMPLLHNFRTRGWDAHAPSLLFLCHALPFRYNLVLASSKEIA